MEMLNKLRAFLDSEEGKKATEEFCEKLRNEAELQKFQLERAKRWFQKNSFSGFIDKVICKYNSDKYRDFWYSKSIEPPEPLFSFLFEYAKTYGREASSEEYSELGCSFTAGIFYLEGYYFELITGQGSAILIKKA